MALTLDAVGLIEFFDGEQATWRDLAKKSYDFFNTPNTD